MAKKSAKDKEENWWRKYTKGYLENAESSSKSTRNSEEKSEKESDKKSGTPEYHDPFKQMEAFSRQMDRLFGDAFKFSSGSRIPRVLKMKEGTFRRPRAEIKETEDKVFVAVELPGVDKDNIRTTIEGRNLIIDAEKKSESRKNENGFSQFRSGYQGYRHVIQLPAEIEKKDSKGKYENGILKLVLKKKDSNEGPSDIDIE